MKNIFGKIFGIYPKEGFTTFRFALLAVFWSFGGNCGLTLSQGLFLNHVGIEYFPSAYFITAVGMIALSTVFIYLLRITSPYKIFTTIMGIGVLLFILSSIFLLGPSPSWFLFILKIFCYTFQAILIACFWSFVDQYHDLQDAKRVYALYNGAYFLGTILAGLSINLYLQTLRYTGLYLLSALSIILAIIETHKIVRNIAAVDDDTIEGIFSSDKGSLSSKIQVLFHSPFTITLLTLSLVIELLIVVTEFNYMETFSRAFNTKVITESTITEFLGKWRAWIATGNLCIGTFCYGRFVRNMGLNNSILIPAMYFFFVYIGWTFKDSLFLALLGFIAIEGMLYTFDDNNFNLLMNIVPTKLRTGLRMINDSFFEPIGMLISSVVLVFLQSFSRWCGFFLAIIMLSISLLLRILYRKAIYANLKENAVHFERTTSDWIDKMSKREKKETVKDCLCTLQKTDEELQLLACEALLVFQNSSLLDEISFVAKNFSTKGKLTLLSLLEKSCFSSHAVTLKLLEQWMKSDPQFQTSGNYYLAKKGLAEILEPDLENADPYISGAAIHTLKKFPKHTDKAKRKLEHLLQSSNDDHVCMGLSILSEDNPEMAKKALPMLKHKSLFVRRCASFTIAKLSDKQHNHHTENILSILRTSSDSATRMNCLEALGKIQDLSTVEDILSLSLFYRPNERRLAEAIITKMGHFCAPLLLSITKDLSQHDTSRITASKILARVALPQLQENLKEIITIEIDKAYFYFYYGKTICEQYPLCDLKLLQDALMNGFQSVIDFIIHLMGAAGSIEDCELIVHALRSKNAKIHSQAVETLEKNCNRYTFRLIRPLIEDVPWEEQLKTYKKLRGNFPKLSLSELLDKMAHSPSVFDKVVSAKLIAKLRMPNWKQSILKQMKKNDENFHQFAYQLLEA